MTKLLYVVSIAFLLTVGFIPFVSQAQDKNSNQASEHFMLEILGDNVRNSVSKYYDTKMVSVGSENAIFIKYGHGNQKDFVETFQSEKGNELENSFVIKVEITPQKKKKDLGRDTITFGVEKNQNGEIDINMLDYEHEKP